MVQKEYKTNTPFKDLYYHEECLRTRSYKSIAVGLFRLCSVVHFPVIAGLERIFTVGICREETALVYHDGVPKAAKRLMTASRFRPSPSLSSAIHLRLPAAGLRRLLLRQLQISCSQAADHTVSLIEKFATSGPLL